MTEVTYPLAFAAGVLSFLSPCVLPLVPSYVSFITGMSFEELTERSDRARVRRLTITNSLAFVLGFSVVFIALGASTSYVGQLFREYQDAIRIVGGVLVIIFGLFIMGLFKMDFLMREKKFHFQGRPSGYLGVFAVGLVFAAGWTPCIGPILGGILLYATSQGSAVLGLKLLSVYSLGLAIPFLLSALAINSFLSYSKAIRKYMKVIMFVSGVVLIAFGVLLLTDKVSELANYFPDLGIDL
ncbi:MAG: cytochrome c biogenesis protein CcdA [Nitrospirota bacterium]|jgi:cytochrome c-type biogenesis protein